MARDEGLEELLREELEGERGLSEKRMFGGLAWLLYGNLLCAASDRGMLIRLGKGNDAWALEQPDIERLMMHGRSMEGWLRAGPDSYGDDTIRRKLLDAALAFVRTLPVKM
jgi:hypothetical protein